MRGRLTVPGEALTSDHVPVVHTEKGCVSGSLENGVRVFKGIPYAQPPLGPLRWRPPRPVDPWAEVRPALRFGPDCPQDSNIASRAPHRSEDCLYLNVWAPARAQAEPLPVMVWVHGGSFIMGSGAEALFDPTHLARENVVVVTINYRLGIFGFLAHPDLTAESPHRSSSNYALLDQLAAFDWVKTNIAAFGGDPGRVTAFGVSAGSASLSLLLTSPLYDGHFSGAIMQSPGAARRLATLEDAERAGYSLASGIEALRQLSEAELLAKTPLLAPKVRGLTTPRILRPICDGWVIPQEERKAFESGRLPKLPMIVGTNTDEGAEATASWPIADLAQFNQLIEQNFPECPSRAFAQYQVNVDEQVRQQVANLFGDTQFNYGARLLAKTMAARGSRTWRYVFTRRYPGQCDCGPFHGQEVAYVFGNLETRLWADRPAPPSSEVDRHLSRVMLKAWLAFAKTGDPNNADIPKWECFDPLQDNFLEFGDAVQAGSGWREGQLAFLDDYFGGVFQPAKPPDGTQHSQSSINT